MKGYLQRNKAWSNYANKARYGVFRANTKNVSKPNLRFLTCHTLTTYAYLRFVQKVITKKLLIFIQFWVGPEVM